MPWIPEDAPPNILAAVSASQWMAWADGASLDVPPHRQAPTVFACQITKDMTSPDGIRYKKGMQGQFLGMSDKNNDMARIFIQGVTEGDGFTNRFVPKHCLALGKQWSDDIDKWRVQVTLNGPSFDTSRWADASLPDTTTLGVTITRLVTAFCQSSPPFASSRLTDFLENLNIAAVCRTIIQGIKDAGLYGVLSNPAGFTVQELINKAKFTIQGLSSSRAAGVYGRIHRTNNEVKFWKKLASYLYVGKTNDFGNRHKDHKNTKSSYGEMTRNSTSLIMIALCILRPTEHDGLFFLTEQVIVCLLQTYKDNVLVAPTNSVSLDFVQFCQPAQYLTNLAREVFRVTRWPGAVSQSSFGIQNGANCSSPLLEFSSKYERYLFIRTDADIKDGKTGQVVPMAFYHRSEHVNVRQAKRLNKSGGNPVMVYGKSSFSPKKSAIKFGFTVPRGANSSDWPLPGTPYELVFEVRKDGSHHPYAWARLPHIGGYENWSQANSFAVRIEWQSPPKSGQWKYRYLQAHHLWLVVDKNAPGSLPTYAKGISFIQWLTNSAPNHQHSWITRISGSARVLQAKYDFMTQTITFVQPAQNSIRMLPGHLRSLNTVKALMLQPKHGLEGVDNEFGEFSNGKNRASCDSCLLWDFRQKDMDGKCIQRKDGEGCTLCMHLYGRPCCSWTPSLVSLRRNAATTRTAEQESAAGIATVALVLLPVAEMPKKAQSFHQKLRKLESTQDYVDDGSDYEDEDEEDAEDFD